MPRDSPYRRLDTAIRFTETYRRYELAPIAVREAMCLKALYPAILAPIRADDLFAGRVDEPLAGFKQSWDVPRLGYYLLEERLRSELARVDAPAPYPEEIESVIRFWRGRTTQDRWLQQDRPVAAPEVAAVTKMPGDDHDKRFAAGFFPRMAEVNLDFDKLLRLGVPGLRADVQLARERAHQDMRGASFHEGLLLCLELFVDICRFYSDQATEMTRTADNPRRGGLERMAAALEAIIRRPPQTLCEAIQLCWLYAQVSALDNFGRMDVYLGDFYARDLAAGRLTETEALALLQGLWRLIDEFFPTSGRVILGGRGRRNEPAADLFALAALETTRIVRGGGPTVCLRFSHGQNPRLFEKGLEVIGAGTTYPLLYNDEVIVPGLAGAFHVTLAEAEQYITSNCGEYGLDHRTVGSPNGVINYPKVLELALFNGFDPVTGEVAGIRTGDFTTFASFDELWRAFQAQAEFFIRLTSDHLMPIYRAAQSDGENLFASLLFDDCLARDRGLIAGARYVCAVIESHGLMTVADSLTAVKHLVFDTRTISAQRLLKALRANFAGYERERHQMLNAPKYGNDQSTADDMAVQVHDFVGAMTQEQAGRIGAHACLATHISVDEHIRQGANVGATPDGRPVGAPITNSSNPLAHNDRSGATALLTSMARLRPTQLGGQVQHLKLTPAFFAHHCRTARALLEGYFNQGGSQLSIAVMGRGDLENAMREPEKYPHLMVRVGGFSARFVTLYPELQREIIARTLY